MTSPLPSLGSTSRAGAVLHDRAGDPATLSPLDSGALRRIANAKYGNPPAGWRPAMRQRFGYFTPDDIYEALVDRLITPGCRWLDVGCGRDVFPTNRALARELSDRCGRLVGLDPDATIQENPFVHTRVQRSVEDNPLSDVFDVVTARMVAEHVSDPIGFVNGLRRLCAPCGLVVIYTVNKWAPASIASSLIPFAWHHPIKAALWGTSERDTFQVEYLMNTRRTLAGQMREAGFEERYFEYLDDCRTLSRFKWSCRAELLLWKSLKALGLRYPETCLLAVYQLAGGDERVRSGGGRTAVN